MIKSEKGVSAVEFALIAPLLFVLTFGIIEFSLLLFDKAVITNASREGARAAIVWPGAGTPFLGKEAIKQIVIDYTGNHLISLGTDTSVLDTNVSYTDKEGAASALGVSEGDVTVTVTYPYSFLVFTNLLKLIDGDMTGTINLTGTTVMRME